MKGEGVLRDSFFKNTDSGKKPTYGTFALFKEQITQKGKWYEQLFRQYFLFRTKEKRKS